MINAEAVRRRDAETIENLLSEQVLDAAIEVHRTLGGPGLLEGLHEDALFYELRLLILPLRLCDSPSANEISVFTSNFFKFPVLKEV